MCALKKSLPTMQELVVKYIVKGFDIDEYKEGGTQIVKEYKGKVTTIRKKKKSWVVQDDEDDENG